MSLKIPLIFQKVINIIIDDKKTKNSSFGEVLYMERSTSAYVLIENVKLDALIFKKVIDIIVDSKSTRMLYMMKCFLRYRVQMLTYTLKMQNGIP